MAATTRTSTRIDAAAPTGSTSPFCSARSTLAWVRADMSPISSREDGAAVGGDKLTQLLAHGAGEAALLVAEELGLDQLVGDRRAVDLDEGALAPRARAVDGTRHQLFAGAALAGDQHRRRGRRRLLDGLAQRFIAGEAPTISSGSWRRTRFSVCSR